MSATASSTTFGGATCSKLVVTFLPSADQRNWMYARIYMKNIQGKPNYQFVREVTQSPFITLLLATGDRIQIAVGNSSPFREVNDYTKAKTTAVILTK